MSHSEPGAPKLAEEVLATVEKLREKVAQETEKFRIGGDRFHEGRADAFVEVVAHLVHCVMASPASRAESDPPVERGQDD